MIEQFLFDLWMRPLQVLPLRVTVDLGVMARKGYSTFLKAPGLTISCIFMSYPGHSLVSGGGGGVLTNLQDAITVLYNPSRQGWAPLGRIVVLLYIYTGLLDSEGRVFANGQGDRGSKPVESY